jgi:hypothetical protein
MPNICVVFSGWSTESITRRRICEICKKWGHHPTEFPLLHKYQSTPRNLFCNFCKSTRHEEQYFCVFDLMKERTSDMYMIQEENVVTEGGGP